MVVWTVEMLVFVGVLFWRWIGRVSVGSVRVGWVGWVWRDLCCVISSCGMCSS